MKEIICVFGIAPCLEEDLNSLSKIVNLDELDFMAVGLDASDRIKRNIVGVATYHTEDLDSFRERRRVAGGNLNYKTHTHQQSNYAVDYQWPLVDRSPLSGSSAYLGAQASVGMGYKKIILCGCPLMGVNLMPSAVRNYNLFQKGWIKHVDKLEGKVRSMSGFTKEFLGYPDEEWIK